MCALKLTPATANAETPTSAVQHLLKPAPSRRLLTSLGSARRLVSDSDPTWLGETLSFEGACDEQSGQTAQAAAAYRGALDSSP